FVIKKVISTEKINSINILSVYSKNFKHQLIWQKSLELVQEIYALTRQLDITKQKNLITQLRNNVDALHSNIALSLIKIYSNSYNDIILQSLDLCDNLRAQILLLLKDQYITEIIANDKLEKINTIYQALYELLKEKNLPYSAN
ncbi:MAG TPA: four helix bundle protein, partial [Bacteroidales bacterium]|nr:four helix bundle protein [Bacteroidales bacterium]